MRSTIALLAALFAVFCVVNVSAIDNGVGWLPIMGWSTWDAFRTNVTEEIITTSAKFMANSKLFSAGYNYIMIDDGWSTCKKFNYKDTDISCMEPGDRDDDGRIVPDPDKFPNGMKHVTDYIHKLGLKAGIYTAVSKTTCGGYPASLGYEEIDAKAFVEWGFDFVKHDTCNSDCGIHTGCLQDSTTKMSKALNATGVPVIYYIDAGNPTSGQKVYNPHHYHEGEKETLVKTGVTPSELAWNWAKPISHMWKNWLDVQDTWRSTIDNLHHQVRLAEYQECGSFNFPDYLTIGEGKQKMSEYRAQFFTWAINASPLLLGADIRKLTDKQVELLISPEILAINQDPDCTQGSISKVEDAFEIWIKPLSDGHFAVVFLNKSDKEHTIVSNWKSSFDGDFIPAFFKRARVRDLYKQKDLGVFENKFEYKVGAHDAAFFKFTVVNKHGEPIASKKNNAISFK